MHLIFFSFFFFPPLCSIIFSLPPFLWKMKMIYISRSCSVGHSQYNANLKQSYINYLRFMRYMHQVWILSLDLVFQQAAERVYTVDLNFKPCLETRCRWLPVSAFHRYNQEAYRIFIHPLVHLEVLPDEARPIRLYSLHVARSMDRSRTTN